MSTTPSPAHIIGPDFVALIVRDLDVSRQFYTELLGLPVAPMSPPGAVVFATTPIPFAVRLAAPGADPIAESPTSPRAGNGVALWFALAGDAFDVDRLCEALQARGVRLVSSPSDGPFGRLFQLADPDGYVITIHSQSPRTGRPS